MKSIVINNIISIKGIILTMRHDKAKALAAALIVSVICCMASHAEEKQKPQEQTQPEQKQQPDAKGLDMVSDTVASVFSKANALLAGNLEITMSKDKENAEDKYTRNAIGQKVPKSTAVKSAGSLHNDEPL